MISKKEDSSLQLDQVYQEYIQFVNEWNISRPISILMMAIADVVILSDLLIQLAPDNKIVQNLSYLGISSMLYTVNQESSLMAILIDCLILGVLLSPIVTLITIIYHVFWTQSVEDGTLKQIFQKSLINSSIRLFYGSFPYLWLPVFSSYGAKIINEGGTQKIFGILIIIWVILNSILIEYHTFELGNDQSDDPELVPLNYPSHMIDNLLIVFALLTINITGGSTSLILGLVFICLRLALSLYSPFFSDSNQQYYKLVLFSALIASLGLFIAYYNIDRTFNLLLIAALVGYLLSTRKNPREEQDQWQEVRGEPDLEGIQAIKTNLTKLGLFSKCFRELIFLSRQNRSHRGQLQIQILKSKCLGAQKVHRGGSRMIGARDVTKFQQKLVRFLENLLKACQQSVSLLKFMQSKDGKKQILAKEVGVLIKFLNQNKIILRQLFQLNQYSSEVKFLLLKTYSHLYSDGNFLKEFQKWMGESVFNQSQKELKQSIFNDKSVVVFINVLEEIGKVVKISKNLPSVLGYEPNNLLGLSINQIIPTSVSEHHDQNLLDFLDRYSSKTHSRESSFQFFAYNSQFHLQEVVIRYSWVMNDFNSFYMAGVLQRVESDTHVILTDEYGNLEGWTKKIGGEQFNLDLISIGQRKNYNIMPLFPTLIKYMDSLGVLTRTLFFKNAKPRDSNLLIGDGKGPLQTIQKKLLNSFKNLAQDEEIVGACFAEIEMKKVCLCQGKAKMLQITIKEYENIQNLSQILNLVQKMNTNNSFKTDKSLVSCNDLGADSQRQQKSIFSEDGRNDKKIDANFTLVPEGENFFSFEQIVLGQFNSSKTTFEISTVCQNMKNKMDRRDEAALISPDSSFNFTLHKNGSLIWHVLILSVVMLVLYILNVIAVTNAGTLFTTENQLIIARNKATAIYMKSIFNPNASFVSKFANGALLDDLPYLYQKKFNYTTFLGDVIEQNQYYMFNTQILATLNRLVRNPLIYSSATVDITPPTNADYYKEMTYNYQGVIREYNNKFTDALDYWSQRVGVIRTNFFIHFVFLCLGAIVYGILLGVTFWRENKHKDTLQAFFKFEKQDLQAKIGGIGSLVRVIEGQASELNLLKEFSQIVKNEEITNIQFALMKNPYDVKVKFSHDQETETEMEQKRYYIATAVIILFLLTQLVFLLVHAIINQQALAFYENTPKDLDKAAKLIVFPYSLLADVHLPLPESIIAEYDQIVNEVLGTPITSIPNLYPFLGTVPCVTCNFMYPVLTTNYKSFYSTFQQQAVQMKYANVINKTRVQDMFYACDYVTGRVIPVILTASFKYVDWSVVLFVLSVVLLCVAIYIGERTISVQIDELQLFLHFFGEETIAKNKHISRLFSNFD